MLGGEWIGQGKNGSSETQAITVVWVAGNKGWWQNELDVGGLDVGSEREADSQVLDLSN